MPVVRSSSVEGATAPTAFDDSSTGGSLTVDIADFVRDHQFMEGPSVSSTARFAAWSSCGLVAAIGAGTVAAAPSTAAERAGATLLAVGHVALAVVSVLILTRSRSGVPRLFPGGIL